MNDSQTRQRRYKLRKRAGRMLVTIEVGQAEIAALRQLELLPPGDPDTLLLRIAVQRFIACAPAIAAIPDRLYGS